MDNGTHLVFLVRHGQAMEREAFQKEYQMRDRFRPLTDKGVKKFKKVAQKFSKKLTKKLKVKKNDLELLYSPFTRAHQTAELLEHELKIKGQPFEQLEHAKSVATLVNFVETKVLAKSNKKAFMFVGHEPELSSFYEKLANKKIDGFRKGEVRCLVYSPKKDHFKVAWRLLPKR